MRITAIERVPRQRRYKVRLGEDAVIPLSREVLAAANLRVGDELSSARIGDLQTEEARHAAMAAALRLLSYRPRSEREMRDALRARRVPEDIAEGTLLRLKELRLLDDRAFAANWAETRQHSSPRSRRLLFTELAGKGVTGEAASQAVQAVDDEEAAERAGRRRAQTLSKLEFTDFRRRLGDFLLRRGFSYSVCESAVRKLWAEVTEGR
jgi:regulatory protein